MNGNDTITTTRINLHGGSAKQNPFARGTSEWAAWEAGYAAGARRPTPDTRNIR